jgi:hypothetical protein
MEKYYLVFWALGVTRGKQTEGIVAGQVVHNTESAKLDECLDSAVICVE